MKIHLIKEKTIELYCKEHPASRESFKSWLDKLNESDWNNPADLHTTFVTADLLGKSSQRVIFNIGGGNYRMICRYGFGKNKVHLFICWIGSHAEYDKINKAGKQYTIKVF